MRYANAMLRWGRFAWAYAILAGACLALIWTRRSPLVHPEPRLALDASSAHLYSLALGLCFGALVVVSSRFTVKRYGWAAALHRELRPFALGLTPSGVLVLAALSSFGEELLFRGLLQPWMGWVPQAVVFGLAHQMPGSSRWVWVVWATVVGLVLGALFEYTGSLLGPLAAHALVNALNLHFLRRHEPLPSSLPEGLSARATRAGT